MVASLTSRFLSHNNIKQLYEFFKISGFLYEKAFICRTNPFFSVYFKNCSFNGCKLKDSHFSNTLLKNADFNNVDLLGTVFHDCDLCSADFSSSMNYNIDPRTNKMTKTKFSLPEAAALLHAFDITLV